MSTITCALTGAAGRIGYQFCFQALSRRLFGNHTTIHFKLIDLPGTEQVLEGLAMELNDTAHPCLENVSTYTDFSQGIQEADYVILIGAMPRSKGMERSDLLAANAAIFREQGRILDSCGPKTKVIVVGNPANTNASIIAQSAPSLTDEQVFSLMTLDENRAKNMLARKLSLPVTEITQCCIFGNHSPTMFPDFYNAQLTNGTPITQLIDESWLRNEFVPTVQNRGAQVINHLGSSSAGSAAASIADLITYLHVQSERIFSLGLVSRGEYNSKPGTFFSMPCQMTPQGIRRMTDFQHNDLAKAYISRSIEELSNEFEQAHV